MERRTLGIDLDGVLVDFVGGYRTAVAGLTGAIIPAVATCWDWDLPIIGKEGRDKVFGWLKENPWWWKKLAPLPGASDFLAQLKQLDADHTIYFVSARHPSSRRATKTWLEAWGFPGATLITATDKGLAARALGLDAALEDHVHFAEQMASAGVKVTLLAQPYNEGWEPRVKTYEEWMRGEGLGWR